VLINTVLNLLLTGAGWPLYGKEMKEYIYACPLRHIDKWPISLSIATETQLQSRSRSTAMPVEVPPRPSHKEPLAACVQAAFGHLDPVRLIEWMEFQRLLGVSFVGVHLMSDFNSSAERVFRYTLWICFDLLVG